MSSPNENKTTETIVTETNSICNNSNCNNNRNNEITVSPENDINTCNHNVPLESPFTPPPSQLKSQPTAPFRQNSRRSFTQPSTSPADDDTVSTDCSTDSSDSDATPRRLFFESPSRPGTDVYDYDDTLDVTDCFSHIIAPVEPPPSPTDPTSTTAPPLHKLDIAFNESWGDSLVSIDDDDPVVRIYSQNVNGIYSPDGVKFNDAFQNMSNNNVDIFAFTETHGDELNPTARTIMQRSSHQVWKNNGSHCTIVTSSSRAPVQNSFTKPGGTMVGVTGKLVGRVRSTGSDPYG